MLSPLFRFITLIFMIFVGNSVLAGNPTSSFTVTPGTAVPTGTCVSFVDGSSANDPPLTNWDWTFAGQAPDYFGLPGSEVPPCVTYNTVGAYDVCLTVTESDGDDNQSCQTINVHNEYNIGTENGNTINTCSGMVTDDGGFAGAYANNQNNVVTFCSGSTDFMQFQFQTIDLAAGETINIYEGTGTGGPLIGSYNSGNNGNSPGVVGLNTCMTIEFISDGATTAQGFVGLISCVPDNYYVISGYNGQTITDCGGGATFWDPGGPGGNYGTNENYTITFCAASPTDVVQILYNSFFLSPGDELNAYDGIGTGGSLIYTANNTDNGNNSWLFPGLTITSTDQCITYEFISDGAGTNSGWNGSINCVTPPAPCNANPIASDNFDAAPIICDFSQYCGETSSFYGVDMGFTGQTAVFDGSLENNSWLSFTADSTNASFTVATNVGCSGIQIGIYAVDANENFTWLSPEVINGGFDYTNVNDGFSGTGVLNAQGMTPGETYYIMIDGHGGAVCDYTLTAGIGVQLPDPLAEPDFPMCTGDPEFINVLDQNGSSNVDWEWTWDNGAGGPIQGDSIDISAFPPGTYTFLAVATDFNECAVGTVGDSVTVVIDPCGALPVELLNFKVDCYESNRVVTWQTTTESDNDYFVLERANESLIFDDIETVSGAGTSLESHMYSFEDYQRLEGNTYYRLRQVDYDGMFTYSDIISTSSCTNSAFEVHNVYFDKTTNEIVINYNANKTTSVDLLLSDLRGKSYVNESRIAQSNDSQIRIDASRLQNTSFYILQMNTDTSVDSDRIIISR